MSLALELLPSLLFETCGKLVVSLLVPAHELTGVASHFTSADCEMGFLVTICGPPLSGKSTVAARLAAELQDGDVASGADVMIVRDAFELESWHRQRVFANSHAEKNARAVVKAGVEKSIDQQSTRVVICDSLNYIKGFRYELYCLARSQRVPHCVVFCVENDVAAALQRNAARPDPHKQYDPDALRALYSRFEKPVAGNRWDAPLFEVSLADENWPAVLKDVINFCRAEPGTKTSTLPTNRATQKQKLSTANMFSMLDSSSRSVENALLDHMAQNGSGGGLVLSPGATGLSIPLEPGGTTVRVRIGRETNAAELRQIRRAYIKLARLNPPDDALSSNELAQMYCDHLARILAASANDAQ
ncbi:Protein KTI12-like [Porphyridium purpureum]|uniref:Protein KTI12-like n=1 Tax=Porphyridium purpureum TaxID=35688 RepID=A0A5J4YUQ7_PORPP|nr:Protein KTI12-like [Porphyridium purpureum]|eukprot:POR5429..scf227_4